MIDPEKIREPILRQVYDYWMQKRAAGKFPSRSDIVPQELRGPTAHVFLVDVLTSPLQFKFRFFGSGLVRWVGSDCTGLVVGERDQPGWDNVFEEFRSVAEERSPRHDERIAEQWFGRQFYHHERLALPLSNDGEVVNMLFGAFLAHPY